MEAVLPTNINYLDTLPRAVPSERKRRNFFAANGTQYRCGQTIIIEVGDPRAFLDPAQSFLRFTLTNNSGAQSCNLDFGGGACLLKNFRVQQGGNTILNIQEYARLYNSIIAPTTGGKNFKSSTSIYQQNIAYGTSTQAAAANVNTPEPGATCVGPTICAAQCPSINNLMLANGGGEAQCCVPLVGGLFSQDKLLPLPLVNQSQPIQLIFDLEAINNLGVWTGAPVNTDILISNVRYCAQMVEVPRDVLGFLRQQQEAHGGALVVQASSYEHQGQTLAEGATGTQILEIPSRKRSIKSVQFVCMANPLTIAQFAATAGSGLPAGVGVHSVYNLSCSKNPCLVSYQLRAGSLVMPPTAIRGPGGRQNGVVNPSAGTAAVAGLPNQFANRGEACFEVSRAVGHLDSMIGLGSESTLTYCNNVDNTGTNWVMGQGQAGVGLDRITGPSGLLGAYGAAADGYMWAFSPFMIDLEAYQNQAVMSGLDTKSLSLQMQLHLELANDRSTAGTGAAAGGQSTAFEVDIYTYHDVMYYFNSDGQITYSD